MRLTIAQSSVRVTMSQGTPLKHRSIPEPSCGSKEGILAYSLLPRLGLPVTQSVWSTLPSKRLHPGTDGNRLRDPQPNIRQSLGNPKKGRKDYRSQWGQGYHKKAHKINQSNPTGIHSD